MSRRQMTVVLASLLAWIIAGNALATTSNGVLLCQKYVLRSEVLGEERTLLISLPEGYESSRTDYPVLYLLDAEYFIYQGVSALRFLAECGYEREPSIPQMILVGIVNVDRDRDFTPSHAPEQGRLRFPTSGHSVEFRRFLEEEAMPWVSRQYRTSGVRILVGWSLGGLFTVDTYLSQTSLFSAYLAISPSLWWDGDSHVERARQLLADGWNSPRPLVVTLGEAEGGDMGRSVRDEFLRVIQELPGRRSPVTYLEIAGEGHGAAPYMALLDGLRALLQDWRIPAETVSQGREAVDSFYRSLSTSYGTPFETPSFALLSIASTAYEKGNVNSAIEIATDCARQYPDYSRVWHFLALVSEQSGDLATARTYLLKALEVENRRPVVYSENLKSYRQVIRRVEKKIEEASSPE